MLFFIEDNGYGISVKSDFQTPGGNIAANLASFRNLKILEGDGADPRAAAATDRGAVAAVRGGEGPVLLRLLVPRLSGHSGQDTQAYKSADEIAAERCARSARCDCVSSWCRRLISERGVASARNAGTRRCADVRSAASSERPVPDVGNVDALCIQRGERRRRARAAAAGRAAERRHRAARGTQTVPRRRRAHQHGHGDPPHAGARARGRIRASSCSARTSAARAACMRRRWDCRTSSARRACSTPACRKRASSAARSAWRSPA